MSQENILKLLSGAKIVARNTSEALRDKMGNMIDDRVLIGKYVTREEYDQLKSMVQKLSKQIEELKK